MQPDPGDPAARRRLLEERLRELQDAYYDADGKDEAVILEYLRTLDERRALEDSRNPPAPGDLKLHIGCGDHRLEGWRNVDIVAAPTVDVLADCVRGLPFRDGSAAFIHCEDLIEHLDAAGGAAFLRECFRVLRPGGVLRLLTPDLRALIEKVYLRRESRHLRWCAAQLRTSGPCEALNMHLRMNGEHRFVYDEEHLRRTLSETGFRVETVRWNESRHRELRYLDLRDFGLNQFLEATRPEA